MAGGMPRRLASLLLAAGVCSSDGMITSRVHHGFASVRSRHPHLQMQMSVDAGAAPIEIQILQQQLAAVRNLPRIVNNEQNEERVDPLLDDSKKEPSFRRLFTHDTWARYTGRATERRWATAIRTWRFSSIMRATLPCVIASFGWSFTVACALTSISPMSFVLKAQNLWIPLSLQGTAIGLLLVFRTNNAYLRLAEAREQWGRLLMLLREITLKVSCEAQRATVTCEVCRYLCAFTWSLRDKLRDDEMRDDILTTLLGRKDSEWVVTQRSRPLAILSRLRRLLHAEYKAGALDSQSFYFIETDLKELDEVVESYAHAQ